MGKYVIGIDAGGTMTKAALFDLAGTELACARSRNVMIFTRPGWTERDADFMWGAAARAVQSLLEMAGVAPGDVAAIGVSGYGSGLYLVDRAGRPVRPGIVSTDSRTLALMAEWAAAGLTPQVEGMIQQRVWPGQSLALLAWLQRHEPEVLARTFRVSFCKDFLRTQLCGDFSTDFTDAGSAGLLNVGAGHYAEDALRLLGMADWLPKLPEIGPSNEVAGKVSAAAARLTGLLPGTPVVRGTVDMSASALAANITRPQEMNVVAGTFSIATTLHATPKLDIAPMLQFPYPLGGYLAVEGSATSASNLEWVVKTVLAYGDAKPEDEVAAIYGTVNAAVARRIGQPSTAMFFPYLFGGPGGAQAGFLGLSAQTSFDDMMLSVFEGIVFAHKVDIDKALSGSDAAPVELIRLTGGATRSHCWSALFADILDQPVEVPVGSEFGALGVAICTANAVGAHATLPDAINAMTGIARRHEVDQARGAPHRAKFARFQAISAALAQAGTAERARPAVQLAEARHA